MKQNEWDPLRDLSSVQKQMNRLFESALARTNFETPGGVDAWEPDADVFETPDKLVITLELAGLRQQDIELRVDGDDLLVQGRREMHLDERHAFHRVERTYGTFARRFPLPSTVDRQEVVASYRNGVLEIELPKLGGDRPHAIQVPIR